jgi:hypothetical protein
MKKTVLLATAAVFALAMGSAASAAGIPSTAGFGKALQPFHSPKGVKTLYTQNSNDSGVGLVSQNFTSGSFSPTYNAAGADDFVVPSGKKWKVGEVDVTGVYFNGPGPATSEDIVFYKDASGVPGKAVKNGTFNGLSCSDNAGSFTCTLPHKVRLKHGHYWVSVVANQNYLSTGEWGWEGNATINNDPAQWENPGGGFGVGCTTWGPNSSCLGYNQDDMFDIKS